MVGNQEGTKEAIQGIWDNLKFHPCTNVKDLEEICKNSGSKRVKETRSYLETLKWRAKNTFYAEMLNGYGFYAGCFAKKHFNLVELAVLKEEHGKGFGTILVNRMKARCIERDIHLIKLRTSMQETAVDFWQKQGAKITGYKEEDFTMEIVI